MTPRDRAALVCDRNLPTGPISAEATYWDTSGQAREAESKLTLCGPLCVGVHSVVNIEVGR